MKVTKALIIKIIDYARLAPSVHNTQPWRFSIQDSGIAIFVEPSRALEAGDPTGRELWVSIGICIEATLQAARGLGIKATITSLQTDTRTQAVAVIHCSSMTKKDPQLLRLLKERRSYRTSMQPATIPSSLQRACQKAIKDLPTVSLVLVTNDGQIATIADIADRGMRLALSSHAFRQELAPLLHYNWSPARTGLHGFVLNHGALGSIWEKWSVKWGLGSKRKAHADRQKVVEASALLFILSKGDVPHFWLDVGRAYMRIVLEITQAGLAHSTITAPVEADRFHEDIEKMLGTHDRIQSMIRIGKATKQLARTSPRLSTDELTT